MYKCTTIKKNNDDNKNNNNTSYQSNPKANQPAISENPPIGAKLE